MMPFRRPLALVALVALAAVPAAAAHRRPHAVGRPPHVLTFVDPAGARAAGPTSPNDPYGRILPSGRSLHPTGASVVVGMNALGVALAPSGRYAIVSDDDEREATAQSTLEPAVAGGYQLTVVDTATMRVASAYRAPKETFFVGLAVLPDPARPGGTLVFAAGGPSNSVFVFDLDDAGRLTPDAQHEIGIPASTDPQAANLERAFPGSLVAAPDGRHLYVVDNLGNDVVAIDVAARRVVGENVPVGFFPLGAALTPGGLLVANEGLMGYHLLPAPTTAPPFAPPPPSLDRASSLSLVPTAADGTLGPAAAAVPMDRTPDTLHDVGGAHPAAIAAMRSRPYAFVAMGNVDRIATVALGAQPRVVGGTELRLYDRGPYGTQPAALALDPGERRLYVALAGIDAVAVLDVSDPVHPHRIGLVPTGWYPSALALSSDGRSLFVANAKGFGEEPNFHGDRPGFTDSRGRIESVEGDSNTIWSTLERIDLATLDLRRTTPLALSYLRALAPARTHAVVPSRFGGAGSAQIKHVVLLLEENKTYDAMLGDLTDDAGRPYGPGDPADVSFDASVTPNLHALARRYALTANFFADAEESDAGHQYALGGIASLFTERTLLVKRGRRPLVNKNEDVEDYPRAGYVYNALAAHSRTYRDYGDLVRVNGYDEGENPVPTVDDPHFAGVADQSAPTQGLGGLYALDAPALAVLANRVDLNYPGWNLRIRDVRRAAEFERDFEPLARANAMPAFTEVWLPADHGGAGPNIPPLPEEVADGDRALGRIVDYLSHLPQWSSTAIFIMPDDAQSTRDHVSEHRSYALVVSPYAKRHYLGRRHVSTAGVLKTEEELLGLPALSLGDALATDLGDYFTTVADRAPYVHVDAATQTASAEGRRIAALLARTDQSAADADGARTGRIVQLSRDADRLAAERARFAPADYARAQEALFARARSEVADGR